MSVPDLPSAIPPSLRKKLTPNHHLTRSVDHIPIKPKGSKDVLLARLEARPAAAGITWSGSQSSLHVSSSRPTLTEFTKDGKPVEKESEATLKDLEDAGVKIIYAPKGRVTPLLVITAIITIFGSSFPHGWNTGVLNAPSDLIKEFLNETFTERFDYVPDVTGQDWIWSTTVAIYLLGGCGGAFSVGLLADRLGRQKALLFGHIFGFVAAILYGLCEVARSFEMLILGRLVVGYGCGAGSGLVPMYLTEIAPVNVRGAMGVLHQFALTFGIFTSQIMGMKYLLGEDTRWMYLLAFTAVPCLVSLIVLPFLPDSPRYLLVNKNDEKGARKALQRFRGKEDVELDLDEMRQEQEQLQSEPRWTMRKLLAAKDLRLPLILVVLIAVAQQLSGINVVFYYSVSIFQAAQIPDAYMPLAVISTGFMNVAMTAVSVPLMEKCGRRPLLIGGMGLMAISMGLLTVALKLQDTVRWMSYISCACTITVIIGFSMGLGSIPQFIGAELFKQGPRPPAMSIAGFANWLCNFAVALAFPAMQRAMGPWSFIVFIFFLVIFGLFIWWKLPETKNKSYEEIYQHFRDTGKKDNVKDKDQPAKAHLLNDSNHNAETTFVVNGKSNNAEKAHLV